MSSELARPARAEVGSRAGAGNHVGSARGEGMRVAVAASRFNGPVTERLVEGALDWLVAHGVDPGSITLAWAPGAFELPLLAQRLAGGGQADAVICLGAVIRGETAHYEHVAGQCASGLQRVQLETGVPVLFGVLTCDSAQQAWDRAGGRLGNKGAEAAAAALEVVDVLRQLPKGGGQCSA
jgi:6,7-dimethyl-8-ribityllumazine synthase